VQKGIGYDGSATRFDDLGLYILPTEQEARGFVSQLVPGAQFGQPKVRATNSYCRLSGAVVPLLYGIQVGMSLQDVISHFPEAINEKSVVRALELSKAGTRGRIAMLIENRSGSENVKEVKRFAFQFHNKHLFSLTVELHSPQWKDVEEFIDRRADLLSLLDLPQASAWEPVEGNAKVGKYLICNGIEIRFYAAPQGSANVNMISLTDITVERALASASDLQP